MKIEPDGCDTKRCAHHAVPGTMQNSFSFRWQLQFFAQPLYPIWAHAQRERLSDDSNDWWKTLYRAFPFPATEKPAPEAANTTAAETTSRVGDTAGTADTVGAEATTDDKAPPPETSSDAAHTTDLTDKTGGATSNKGRSSALRRGSRGRPHKR